jgi:hypothetical protein
LLIATDMRKPPGVCMWRKGEAASTASMAAIKTAASSSSTKARKHSALR